MFCRVMIIVPSRSYALVLHTTTRCPVTERNTIFVVTAAQMNDVTSWVDDGMIGRDHIKFGNFAAETYSCGGLPTSGTFIGGGYCNLLNDLHYPGPFADTNGHFWEPHMKVAP